MNQLSELQQALADRDHAREEREKLQAAIGIYREDAIENTDLALNVERLNDALEDREADLLSAREELAHCEHGYSDQISLYNEMRADRDRVREELATLKSDFDSFSEHHAATEQAWERDRGELATLKAEHEKLSKSRHEHFLIVSKNGIAQRERADKAEAELARLQPYVQHLKTCEVVIGSERKMQAGMMAWVRPGDKCTCGLRSLWT